MNSGSPLTFTSAGVNLLLLCLEITPVTATAITVQTENRGPEVIHGSVFGVWVKDE